MALIRFDNVTAQYGINIVFENVSFQLNEGEKCGLVGVNGCGKSTLLKLVTNELQPDKGGLIFTKGVKVGYLRQELYADSEKSLFEEMLTAFSELNDLKIRIGKLEEEMHRKDGDLDKKSKLYGDLLHSYEELGGYTIDVKIAKVLSGLGFSKEEFSRQLKVLSGGQKSRAGLAKLLLEEPDLLLLDEPTNHLDIDSVLWLEEFLRSYKKGALIVSHDRYFLDRVVGKILEIENYALSEYKGNYSKFIELKAERYAQAEKQYNMQKAEIERKEEYIRRNMAGQKTKQAQSRQKELDKMALLKPPARIKKLSLSFSPSRRAGSTVLAVNDLSKSFEGPPLFKELSFQLNRGEKMGIVGPNGTGKTTILKIITGEAEANGGEAKIGTNIDVGYFAQHLTTDSPDNTVIDEVWQVKPSLTVGEMRNYLAKFLFYEEQVFAKLNTLSGGERSRVELAKLILSDINFLILDEPTNHLDIYSRMALEEALADFKGAILTVSHDRYFLDKITDRLLYLEGGSHELFDGKYSELEAQRKQLGEKMAEERTAQNQTPEKKLDKNEYRNRKREERKRINANKSRPLATIEGEIEELDEKLKLLSDNLSNPEIYSDPEKVKEADRKYREATEQLNALYEEWEEAAAKEQ